MRTRREILHLLPAATFAASTPWSIGQEGANTPIGGGKTSKRTVLDVETGQKAALSPLDVVRVHSKAPGKLVVRDGGHEIYLEMPIKSTAEFTVSGQLGTHSVSLLAADGSLIDSRTFFVDCVTSIEDEGGTFGSLLKNLYWTMCTDGPMRAMRYQDQVFTFWDSWLMDNTQTLKGMKYFWPEVKSNVDFYANSQREDGMI